MLITILLIPLFSRWSSFNHKKDNTTYTVQGGDTLSKIASQYAIPLESLYQINSLSSDSNLSEMF